MIQSFSKISAWSLLLIGATVAANAQMSYTPRAPAHLALAEEMALCIYWQGKQGHYDKVINDQRVPFNNYGSKWEEMTVIWGSTTGVAPDLIFQSYYKFNGVCASFVTQMLTFAYDWDWSVYPLANEIPTQSPNSRQYAQLIVNNQGFSQVTNVTQVVAGDILAIDYKQDQNSESNRV